MYRYKHLDEFTISKRTIVFLEVQFCGVHFKSQNIWTTAAKRCNLETIVEKYAVSVVGKVES